MNRVALVEKALQVLAPGVQDRNSMDVPRVDRQILQKLMLYVRYLVWPKSTHTPPIPSHVDNFNRFEWVVRHVAEILVSQIQCAFLTHGDPEAVIAKNTFEPAPLSARADINDEAVAADIQFRKSCRRRAMQITEEFLVNRLIHVRELLNTDVDIAFKSDVAATSPSEVIHSYPGVRCMLYQRVAHVLYRLGVPNNLTRALTEIAHSITGIDIHPHTQIGHHFFIDHGTGIVVGATAIIGNYVSLYQGVTLGAKSFPVDKKTGEKIRNLPRHPIIEDHVTIYANAVVLGRITIGTGSTIGGNCWVVQSLPPHSTVAQKGHRTLETKQSMFEYHDGGSGI